MGQGTCDAPDCDTGKSRTDRYCAKHRWRLRIHGSFDLPPKPTMDERFWAKVDKGGPLPERRPELGPCWIWTAAKLDTGYGIFGINNKTKVAHRVGYELVKGAIPDGLVLDHLCRRTSCVRWSHLDPVPQGINTQRGNWPEAIRAYHERCRTRTHCRHGHELTPENTYIDGKGTRTCRECVRVRYHQRKASDPGWHQARREASSRRRREQRQRNAGDAA